MDRKDPWPERAMGESLLSALLHSSPVSSTIKSKNRRKNRRVLPVRQAASRFRNEQRRQLC